MNSQELVASLKKAVASERKIMAYVLKHIREIDKRKVYLEYGYTSLFAFLVKEIGYCRASAQLRIDAVHMSVEVPTLNQDISEGALDLTKVALVAQAARQKPTTAKKKAEILETIKHKTAQEAELIVAQALDLTIHKHEKQRMQKDESVRVELTFTKEQMEILTKAKNLMSHTHPGATLAEIITALAQDHIQRKDPSSRAEPTRRQVFARDQHCQWENPNGEKCQSQYQLEVDHIQPKWAGGSDDPENLQLLCATHNKLKYRREAGLH